MSENSQNLSDKNSFSSKLPLTILRLQKKPLYLKLLFFSEHRIVRSLLRMFIQFSVVLGFLSSVYLLGWYKRPLTGNSGSISPLLLFLYFAVALWFYAQQIKMPTKFLRWVMLLPLAFLLGTLRHIAPWGLTLLGFLFALLLSYLFHLLRGRSRKERFIDLGWDIALLLLLFTQLFLPRKLFAALLGFVPTLGLVIFYNFILERDRLLRAKALVIEEAQAWLIKANKLLPPSTYLFLLLPSLLFSEALLFHALYTPPKSPTTMIKQLKHPMEGELLPPTLMDWLKFTVTIKIKAHHKNEHPELKKGEVQYLDISRGFIIIASLIRAFLIFFYAKRLLLIYLMLMDSLYGIRVHRLGLEKGIKEALSRLNEHRQILLRTLNSFPRIWAAFLLRGIQGKHDLLDPVGSLIRAFISLKQHLEQRLFPSKQGIFPFVEPEWSRLVREEEINLLKEMKDYVWSLEAFIDLIYPEKSHTLRGKLYYYTHLPIIGKITEWYFKPPEVEVRAKIIEEIPSLLKRALEQARPKVTLSEEENEALSYEQVWQKRDRVLLILNELLHDQSRTIRVAAMHSIAQIADLPRPLHRSEQDLWAQLAKTLFEKFNQIEVVSSAPNDETSLVSLKNSSFDPFERFLRKTVRDEEKAILETLGYLGTKEAATYLFQILSKRPDLTKEIFHALGLGERANGLLNSGLADIEEFLIQHILDEERSTALEEALESLVRLSYPTPIAQSFQEFLEEKRSFEKEFSALVEEQRELEKFDKNRSELSKKERELLGERYQNLRERYILFEENFRNIIQQLGDTFWNTLHYNNAIIMAAYLEGEGFEQTPEFNHYLMELSLDDTQDWKEFFANLPHLSDTTSWIAPFHQFSEWVIADDHATSILKEQNTSLLYAFFELCDWEAPNPSSKEKGNEFQQFFQLYSHYKTLLYTTLKQFIPCLRARAMLSLSFDEENQSEWQLTLSGLKPWLQPIAKSDESTTTTLLLPNNAELNSVYLIYEQYAPLRLNPFIEISWENPPENSALVLQHGYRPQLSIWGYNFIQLPQIHLRQLGYQKRHYWHSNEKLTEALEWEQQLKQLISSQERYLLEKIDREYINIRCQASFRQVFAKSRLREQDPLMISRDFERKLDNFLERKTKANTFLLSGEAGVGATTLLLRHCRTTLQYRENKEYFTLFLDASLLAPNENLASWFIKEMNLELTPSEQQLLIKDPLHLLKSILAVISAHIGQQQLSFVLYGDNFHEHPHGIQLFIEFLKLAQALHSSENSYLFILAIRETFLEQHIDNKQLQPFVQKGRFLPPEQLFYREIGHHGIMMKLTHFLTEPSLDSPDERSELVRAYRRYYNFTDTSGTPRYRPLLEDIDALEHFGMTRTLLTYPTLLPVIMETFHREKLPDNLKITELFLKYLKRFSPFELEFMKKLTKMMLYGSLQSSSLPHLWDSRALIEERKLLQNSQFSEYISGLKQTTQLYDDLRAHGILIRHWKLPQGYDSTSLPVRHVTFTSTQLLEFLLYEELLTIVPDWKKRKVVIWDGMTPLEQPLRKNSHTDSYASFQQKTSPIDGKNEIEDPVAWLMALADHSKKFPPLAGATTLLLMHLIEKQEYQIIADFNDRSIQRGRYNRHLLFNAFTQLPTRILTKPDGLFNTILRDLSKNDLELLLDFAKDLENRGHYEETEQIFSLILDQPHIAIQTKKFPDLMTDIFLERVQNKQQLSFQKAGGLLSEQSYISGKSLYWQALKSLDNDPLQKIRILRYLARYEINASRLEEAEKVLQQASHLLGQLNDAEHSTLILQKAWIYHLKSALIRRSIEGFEAEEDPQRRQELLRQAHLLAQEALDLLDELKSNEHSLLFGFIYDNIARIILLKEIENPSNSPQPLKEASQYFKSALQLKHSLNDYLGMAKSYIGLAKVYLQRVKIAHEKKFFDEENWKKSYRQLELALKLNSRRLHSHYGIALVHFHLAELYTYHPEENTFALNEFAEALIMFARLNDTAACQHIIQQIVQELAKLPIQEMRHFLSQIIEEIGNVSELSDWILTTLWNEFSNIFGDKVPKIIRDFFISFMQ